MESWGNGGAGLDESMEESEEYRLLEAYCDRRRQQRFRIIPQGPVNSKSQDHAQFSEKPMRPNIQIRMREPIIVKVNTSGVPGSRVIARLVQIADSALLHEDDDLESDGTDDDVFKELVELLKKHGDELDEKIKKDKTLQQKIQKSLSYGLFEKVTTAILESLVAPRGGCAAAAVPCYKQQIAWACEVTHRLSAVDCIPRRRALVFGTQYIQQHLSAWVQQQGGWDSAFEDVD